MFAIVFWTVETQRHEAEVYGPYINKDAATIVVGELHRRFPGATSLLTPMTGAPVEPIGSARPTIVREGP